MIWLCGRRHWRLLERSPGKTVKAEEGPWRVGSELAPGRGPFLEGDMSLEAETAARSVCVCGDPPHRCCLG